MQMTHKIWMGTSAVILTAVLAAAGWQIWQQQNQVEITATAPLPSCDLQQGPCQASFPNGTQITLTISPRPIVGLKQLELQVEVEGIEADAVEVDFRGLGMNMGYNRPHLKPESEGRFSGTGVLSVCVLDRMTWEATVLASTDQGIMAAPFQFETLRK